MIGVPFYIFDAAALEAWILGSEIENPNGVLETFLTVLDPPSGSQQPV